MNSFVHMNWSLLIIKGWSLSYYQFLWTNWINCLFFSPTSTWQIEQQQYHFWLLHTTIHSWHEHIIFCSCKIFQLYKLGEQLTLCSFHHVFEGHPIWGPTTFSSLQFWYIPSHLNPPWIQLIWKFNTINIWANFLLHI